MRAWQRFKILDDNYGPLRFRTLCGRKHFVILLVWPTRHPSWQQTRQPLKLVTHEQDDLVNL